MKKNLFLRILQACEVLVLILMIVSIFLSFPAIFQKPPVVVTKPIIDNSDWLVENKIEKPVDGFINGIYPDAKIETEKIDLPQEPPQQSFVQLSKNAIDSFDTSVYLFRRKIVLDTLSNQFALNNYLVSIKLDVLTLIRESKVSFTCDQIYFTDEDGKTVISHWIEYGCGNIPIKFWIRIPFIKPNSKKSIYCYYGNDRTYTYSNKKTTFLQEKDLLGWYYLNGIKDFKVLDFSGAGNDAALSKIDYGEGWSLIDFFEKRKALIPLIFFNDWQSWRKIDLNSVSEEYKDHYREEATSTYLSVPSYSMKTLSHTGSIEVRLKLYYISEQIIQRFFVDSNQQLEIGFSYDGRIFFQNENSKNRIYFKTKLQQGQWYHLVCTWDFNRKSVILYIDGKQINQIPQKIPFNWKQTKPLGDLKFGGYHTFDDDYGFSGYLNCLRIYNKQITKSEAEYFYKVNQESLHFPEFITQSEEKISVINQTKNTINFKNISQFPVSKNLELNLVYATPINNYIYGTQIIIPPKPKPLRDVPMIIDRTTKDYHPIFGFEGHFYSYLGTELTVKDTFLVNYIGLKINDPTLLRDLKVEFSWYVSDSIREFDEDHYGFLDFLFPKAFACGPFYSFETLGESNLELICVINGISWFKTEKPIFVNPTVSVMQIYYKPTTKLGVLKIELVDMLFLNKERKFERPKIERKNPEKLISYARTDAEISLPSSYQANFYPVEKGCIDFRKNKNNGLDMTFSNLGYDEILLNDDTFAYINENLFLTIQIYSQDSKPILQISGIDLKKHLLNQKIKSGYMIYFPILAEFQLPRNCKYFITFYEENKYPEYEQYEEYEKTKIISWTLGKDPFKYFYPQYLNNDLLYELRIDKDGSFQFIETKEQW